MPKFKKARIINNTCLNGHPRPTNYVGNSRMLCRTCLEEAAALKAYIKERSRDNSHRSR